jgi:hypothetical protein
LARQHQQRSNGKEHSNATIRHGDLLPETAR